MNTGATALGALGAARTRSTAATGWSADAETATFSFNLAPSAYVLSVTRPDGSVVRRVTIEEGAVDSGAHDRPERPPAMPHPCLDRDRQRRRRRRRAALRS